MLALEIKANRYQGKHWIKQDQNLTVGNIHEIIITLTHHL